MMRSRVKFCGLRTALDVATAAKVGASYVGFVFFEKSPRHVEISLARELALQVPVGIAKVALVVNPTDYEMTSILESVPIDMIQLHGSETLKRVSEIRQMFGLPVMKAVGISNSVDVETAMSYANVCDQLLLDAKAPPNADIPGGNGHSFDWSLIRDQKWPVPWMLAGGLTSDNVTMAISATGAMQLDVSSGIEILKGQKDGALMQAFMDAVQS